MKICKKCLIEKNYSEFYIEKKSKDGFRNLCKLCASLYIKNIDKYHRRDIVKKSYYKNLENKKEYYQKNIEKIKDKRKKRYKENKELEKDRMVKYSKKNREKLNKYKREYNKKRESIDYLFKLRRILRNLVKISFKNKGYSKGSKTQEILGCPFDEFKMYLESKFEPWMTWDNHGKYTGSYNQTWQLDHIIPISIGSSEIDIIKLNYYLNLQPLCSKKNLQKSNKVYDTSIMGNN